MNDITSTTSLQDVKLGALKQAKLGAYSFFQLCKPRVTSLIVFTAVIGMFLSTPGMVSWQILIWATIGIAFVSGAAAAFNCLIEQKLDAVMSRTQARPLPTGQVTSGQTRCGPGWLRSSWRTSLFFVNDVQLRCDGPSLTPTASDQGEIDRKSVV